MKKIFLVLLVSVGVLCADEFDDVAKNFISYKGRNVTIEAKKPLDFNGVVVGYLFSLDKKGYIIVPSVKNISPIKAFSFKTNFSDLPKEYREFLLKELYSAYENRSLQNSIDPVVAKRWYFLVYYDNSKKSLLKVTDPLLTTSWNQYAPYNKFLPKVGDKQTVVGCVQVALAQVMAYWKYPKIAKGKITKDIPIYDEYNNKVRTDHLTAYLHRYYGWDVMPNDATKADKYAQDAVAYLMRDLLIVNKTHSIGINDTGSYIDENVLIENFGYSKDMSKVKDDDLNFKQIIREQIDKKQPMLISFTTHMAVIDGYEDDDSGNYVHINLGWGGAYDDYYNLDVTNNIGDYSYPPSPIEVIYNIKPCSQEANDCYVNLESNDKLNDFNISGVFDFANDSDKYKLYLKGTTTFKGKSDYSNQAFFISVYNSKGELLKESDDRFSIELPADLYTVRVSLRNSEGGYYHYDENHANYSVAIDSNHLSQSEIESIEQSLKGYAFIGDIKDQLISSPTKLFLYAYGTNDEDNISLDAIYDKDKLDVSLQDNILSITPKETKSYSKVKIVLKNKDAYTSKEFDILTNDKPLYFGKNFEFNGHLSSVDDIQKTDVVLEGSCKISGFRGYSNQAFFTTLFDQNDNLIDDWHNESFSTSNLDFGVYKIAASVSNSYGSYSYDENHSNYTIFVSCPNAEENLTKIATLLGISTKPSNTKILSLSKGWNLVAFDEDITKFDDITIAWQFIDGKWHIYAPNIANDFEKIDTDVNSTVGTWVLVEQNTTIKTIKISTGLPQYKRGWSLAGTSKDLSVDDIECIDSKLLSIWKYKDKKWQLHTNISNDLGLQDFTAIEANEGFWVDCE